MADDFLEKLSARLQPDAIQRCLMRAGLFLAGYELLKSEIQDKVKKFFVFPVCENEPEDTRAYDSEVKILDKSEFRACCKWLHQAGAINETQLQAIFDIRDLRNKVAHELPSFIIDESHEVPRGALENMELIITLLGQFWGGIWVDINSDFDSHEIDNHSIQSGTSILMELIINACAEA